MISSTEERAFRGDSAARDEGRVFATLGPVHLDIVDRGRSLGFWRDAIGLTVLDDRDGALALGAGNNTLVVLHPGATRPVEPRRAGLYHLAIHLPTEPEFARVLARLVSPRQLVQAVTWSVIRRESQSC
ncbi:MAG: hypothetical protein M3072_16485 [Candidatus Dormibacteraeota bacterium]|nr:hypothetical protein [Candidatus Dormibacteraeota bacterium]